MDFNGNGITILSFNTYESVLDHHTYADVIVLDSQDILGQNKLAGDEKIKISFSTPGGDSPASFNFMMVENAKLLHTGAMKAKTYELRMVSPELLKAQKNVVNKSYNDQTSNVVKDILKNYTGTEDEIDIRQETNGKQIFRANSKKPYEVIKKLRNLHVSQDYQNDGSAFALYKGRNQSGDQVNVFTTFKKMMDDDMGLGFTYKQDPTVGSKTTSTSDDYKNIINFYVPTSFYTPLRYNSTPSQSVYCAASGKQVKKDFTKNNNFQLPTGQSPISQQQASDVSSVTVEEKPMDAHIAYDKANVPNQTYIAESLPYKHAMAARLTNDKGWMEVNGNSKITVGQTFDINIPNKSAFSDGNAETQITAKVLAVNVRNKVNPAGSKPRWTTIVEFIKAGFDEGVS